MDIGRLFLYKMTKSIKKYKNFLSLKKIRKYDFIFSFFGILHTNKKKRGDLTLMEKLYIAFPSANKNTVLNIVVFMPHDKENLRGMIQICHGMTEHIDRYDD